MKNFLLLRNNTESGPFTLNDLTAQHLRSTDLIWIEGYSTAWNYPNEIEPLQRFVDATISAEEKPQTSTLFSSYSSIYVALPKQHKWRYVALIGSGSKKEVQIRQTMPTRVESYAPTIIRTKPRKQQTFSNPHNILWIGCIFAGLLFSALLVKDILDTYDINVAKLTTATLVNPNEANSENEAEEHLYQNALTTEMVPIDTVTMQPVKQIPLKLNFKKLVQLEANDYRVGLVGGIKNLRMLVINKSAFILDKVKFELQYLKSNGDVLKTENLVVRSIGPKSSKGLAVPTENQGVKVAYRIIDIQSRQHSNALVNL